MLDTGTKTFFPVRNYDLAATLGCGQAFRWTQRDSAWEGIIGRRWVRLRSFQQGIEAITSEPASEWTWLTDYLQTDLDLGSVLLTFPDDEPMRAAVGHCRGLRLLRQDPWECLASFILSSTKQIVQIQQIITLLCERFGEPLSTPRGAILTRAFPTAERLASATEAELRACKMGFRAPSLLAAARRIAARELDLESIRHGDVDAARAALISLRGVGDKIANCALLFAYGFQQAFPIDVWVMKALRQLYFPKRRPTPRRLLNFTSTHFGPNAGYAQQYLFHYMRTRNQRNLDEQR